jgi:hypothetical protein
VDDRRLRIEKRERHAEIQDAPAAQHGVAKMRTVIGGNGSDTTAAVLAYLAANNSFRLANLYLIGNPEDPNAIWLTDYDSPLLYSCWGMFRPGVITRGQVTSEFGLDVQSLDLTWSPEATSIGMSIPTANPFQLAQMGFYDNWPVRVWTVYMPTPGDANTLGASELFGGRIAKSSTNAAGIIFTVNSFLDVVNEYVPANVVEVLNTLAAYAGATPPQGFSTIPQFSVAAGPSITEINGACTTDPGQVFDANAFQGGFLVFNSGPGATLAGVWSAIQGNIRVTIAGTDYNQFNLYQPLPWPPTPGVDTFYVSAASPINKADGSYYGFPFVPAPETI